MNKTCKICNVSKDVGSFPRRQYKAKVAYRNECKDCVSNYLSKYRKNNADRVNKKIKEWKTNNPEKKRLANYKWFLENKEKSHESVKRHRINNSYIYRQKTAERRFRIQRATFKDFNKEIKEIYKNCPEGYHVDHIVPLKHKDICGLHVPWNLQYLTAEENLKKSNKL